MRRLLLGLFMLIVVAAAGVMVWAYLNDKLEGKAPDVLLSDNITHVGKSTQIQASLLDDGSGLREAKISIVQNHRQIVLWESNFVAQLVGSNKVINQQDIKLSVNAQELGLVQGPATLVVECRDNSWRRFMRGNVMLREFPVQVVLAPPRAALINSNIYINRSGVGVAIYRVTETATISGVKLGDDFYPGFAAWPEKPDIRVCYFAFPDTVDRNAAPRLVATDSVGTSTTTSLPVRLRWRDFKTDTITLSDHFLDMVVERFGDRAPAGVPLQVFMWVNKDLRERSNQMLKQAVAYSEPRQLWRGAFLRPSGKMMSDFVENRNYVYQGERVGTSVHYGLDLADVAFSPVKAAADGRVVFAGDMGVYGNTVIVDHGLNLFTLYAHLSSMEVAVGQNVALGEKIATTGSTGFSFGDHLHFSCIIGSKFVTPYEWWDSHWIADNVETHYKQAGLTAPN